jgi:hypothetical protein
MWNEQMSQALSVAAKIDPTTLNGTSANSGAGVDMGKFHRLMAVVSIGANAGSLVAKWQGATASGGSFSDVAGGAATAVTAANKVITLELRADQVGDAQRFVKLVLTEGNGAAVTCSAVLLGGEALQRPASQQDVSGGVAQRLVVTGPN